MLLGSLHRASTGRSREKKGIAPQDGAMPFMLFQGENMVTPSHLAYPPMPFTFLVTPPPLAFYPAGAGQ